MKTPTSVWASAALLAAFWYAGCNTIAGKLSVQEGYAAQLYQVPGLLICWIFILAYKSVQCMRSQQKWNQWIYDNYYEIDQVAKSKEKGEVYSLRKKRVFLVFLCGVFDFVDNFLFILAYDFSYRSGVNFSVIMSLFSGLPLLISITFYFLFKEKITIWTVSGIGISIAGAALVTFSRHEIFLAKHDTEVFDLHPIWAVFAMFGVLGCITIRQILVKDECAKGADSFVLSFTWSFFMNLLLMVYIAFNWQNIIGTNLSYIQDFQLGFLGGVMGNMGDGLATFSSSMGIGGMASLLSGTWSYIQATMEYLAFGTELRWLDYWILTLSFIAIIICSFKT